MTFGFWQIVLVLIIVLILFGAGKLPKVMGDIATGVKAFKSGMRDEEAEEAAQREVSHSKAAEAPAADEQAAKAMKDEPAKT